MLSLIYADQNLIQFPLLHDSSAAFALGICNEHLTKVLLRNELNQLINTFVIEFIKDIIQEQQRL